MTVYFCLSFVFVFSSFPRGFVVVVVVVVAAAVVFVTSHLLFIVS